MAHTLHLSLQEGEADRSLWAGGQPGLHGENLSQTKKRMEKGREEERGRKITEPKAPTPTALITPMQEAGFTLTSKLFPTTTRDKNPSALAGLLKTTCYIQAQNSWQLQQFLIGPEWEGSSRNSNRVLISMEHSLFRTLSLPWPPASGQG